MGQSTKLKRQWPKHDKDKKERGEKEGDNAVLCAVPEGVYVCPRGQLDKDNLEQYVKVVCSSSSCNQSTWMHPECFRKYEEQTITALGRIGRGRGWNDTQRRQNVWVARMGFELVFKFCECNCGKGSIRKDLDYEHDQIQKENQEGGGREEKKKKKKKEAQRPELNYTYHKAVKIGNDFRVGANSTKAKADREKEKQFKIAESIEIKADQAQEVIEALDPVAPAFIPGLVFKEEKKPSVKHTKVESERDDTEDEEEEGDDDDEHDDEHELDDDEQGWDRVVRKRSRRTTTSSMESIPSSPRKYKDRNDLKNDIFRHLQSLEQPKPKIAKNFQEWQRMVKEFEEEHAQDALPKLSHVESSSSTHSSPNVQDEIYLSDDGSDEDSWTGSESHPVFSQLSNTPDELETVEAKEESTVVSAALGAETLTTYSFSGYQMSPPKTGFLSALPSLSYQTSSQAQNVPTVFSEFRFTANDVETLIDGSSARFQTQTPTLTAPLPGYVPVDQTVPSPLHQTVPSQVHQTVPSQVHQLIPVPVQQTVPVPVQQTVPTSVHHPLPVPLHNNVPVNKVSTALPISQDGSFAYVSCNSSTPSHDSPPNLGYAQSSPVSKYSGALTTAGYSVVSTMPEYLYEYSTNSISPPITGYLTDPSTNGYSATPPPAGYSGTTVSGYSLASTVPGYSRNPLLSEYPLTPPPSDHSTSPPMGEDLDRGVSVSAPEMNRYLGARPKLKSQRRSETQMSEDEGNYDFSDLTEQTISFEKNFQAELQIQKEERKKTQEGPTSWRNKAVHPPDQTTKSRGRDGRRRGNAIDCAHCEAKGFRSMADFLGHLSAKHRIVPGGATEEDTPTTPERKEESNQAEMMQWLKGEVDELGAGIQDQLEDNRNTVKEKMMTIHQRLDALNLEDNLQQLKEHVETELKKAKKGMSEEIKDLAKTTEEELAGIQEDIRVRDKSLDLMRTGMVKVISLRDEEVEELGVRLDKLNKVQRVGMSELKERVDKETKETTALKENVLCLLDNWERVSGPVNARVQDLVTGRSKYVGPGNQLPLNNLESEVHSLKQELRSMMKYKQQMDQQMEAQTREIKWMKHYFVDMEKRHNEDRAYFEGEMRRLLNYSQLHPGHSPRHAPEHVTGHAPGHANGQGDQVDGECPNKWNTFHKCVPFCRTWSGTSLNKPADTELNSSGDLNVAASEFYPRQERVDTVPAYLVPIPYFAPFHQ